MAKGSKPRQNGPSKALNRRDEIRRSLPKRTRWVERFVNDPVSATATAILLGLALVLTALVTSTADRQLPRIGEIMTQTRTYRVSFDQIDESATARERENAASRVKAVYAPNEAWLNPTMAALSNIPRLVRNAESLADVAREDREAFALTEESLKALVLIAADEAKQRAWDAGVERLRDRLTTRGPLLSPDAFRRYALQAGSSRVLIGKDGKETELKVSAIEFRRADGAEVGDRTSITVDISALSDLIVSAVIPEGGRDAVMNRLLWKPDNSIVFQEALTQQRRDAAAAATAPVTERRTEGEIIYARGDRLTVDQYGELLLERTEWAATAGPLEHWLPRAGAATMILLLVAGTGVFVAAGYRRVFENPKRLFAFSVLLAGPAALGCLVALEVPQFELVAALAATLVVAIVTLLAYDSRLALYAAATEAIVLAMATGRGVPQALVLLIGAGTFIIALREVRNRDSIIKAGALTAVTVAVAALGSRLLTLPPVEGARMAALVDAGLAAGGALAVAFLMLGLLPSLERLGDITTGMTLAELRDPSRPLLRALQLRAPGTYNHSLQVATIAEAAADAIGADSLLLYVGALYHDIGKMNKPQYFVENQSDGLNKHDKLRPAMSLLVIIGHVKDGMELAREYHLPRSIQHFIEAHHGTTLVEYFYHAAREAADQDKNVTVDEVEYRYPGPKPRTKEAAILMVSDAVESATRAMSEPNPARIEALVRELSRKRLLDGQFDNCDLTFAELKRIEDAMIARLCAIYHGRVKYPKQKDEDRERERERGEAAAGPTDAAAPTGSKPDDPAGPKTPAPGSGSGPKEPRSGTDRDAARMPGPRARAS